MTQLHQFLPKAVILQQKVNSALRSVYKYQSVNSVCEQTILPGFLRSNFGVPCEADLNLRYISQKQRKYLGPNKQEH